MSFYGHEIHVGVDCFSVEPLGLRPGGSLCTADAICALR